MRKLTIAATTALMSTSAWAVPVLDQWSMPETGIVNTNSFSSISVGAGSSSIRTVAQTFRAGITGRLTHANLHLADWANTTGAAVSIARGGPDGTILGTVTLSTDELPELETQVNFADIPTIDFTAFSINVTAGETYSLILSLAAPPSRSNDFYVAMTMVNSTFYSYADGAAHVSDDGSPWGSSPLDIGFRTYVDPDLITPIPEPAALGLVGFGLAGIGLLGIAGRRRTA